MKKVLVLCLCLVLNITLAMAQSSIKGIVMDESGEPVIGASVIVVGTTTGTITNMSGQFSIGAISASAKKIKVSYIGMVTQILDIKPNMTITLKDANQSLDEVVVVAYGTTCSVCIKNSLMSSLVY